ncbi:MAG: hypothetical protein ACW99U_22330 [Candidatus Thorarchaeota archaeon]
MPNGSDSKERVSMISAVKTPLGFFTLVVLVIEAILTGTTLFSDTSVIWPLLVLALTVVSVTIIAVYKPEVFGLLRPLRINLKFPEGVQVDLEDEECEMWVYKGGKKIKTTPNITCDDGRWSVELKRDVERIESAKLELVETNGDRWKVVRFTRDAKKIQT